MGALNPVGNVQDAAIMAILQAEVMDMYNKGACNALNPAAPAGFYLTSAWEIDGYLIARDTIFDDSGVLTLSADTVFYGVLAHNKADEKQFAAIVRGTEGFKEWLIDAEVKHSHVPYYPGGQCGSVEEGFFSVYYTMQFLARDDHSRANVTPAWEGIKNKVGDGSLIVSGHSLGAALATYLAFDLTSLGGLDDNLQACFFASPRPGDKTFSQVFGKKVSRYVVYNYERDVVPHLPPLGIFYPLHIPLRILRYSPLGEIHEITMTDAGPSSRMKSPRTITCCATRRCWTTTRPMRATTAPIPGPRYWRGTTARANCIKGPEPRRVARQSLPYFGIGLPDIPRWAGPLRHRKPEHRLNLDSTQKTGGPAKTCAAAAPGLQPDSIMRKVLAQVRD